MKITILQHEINYWLDNALMIDDISEEHIKNMIINGCNQGELNQLDNQDKEVRGWWKIIIA